MNRLSEDYKRTVDQNWGLRQKSDLWPKIRDFWPQKKHSHPNPYHVLFCSVLFCSLLFCSGQDREKTCKEKSTLFQNKYQPERKNCCFSVIPAWTGSIVILGATSISKGIFNDDYFDVSDSFLEAILYPKYEV